MADNAERQRMIEAVTTYMSGQKPKSQIANQGFMGRLSSLWGWRKTDQPKTAFEKSSGMEIVEVQADNPSMRSLDAAVGSIFKNIPLSDRLEKLFEAWLKDSTSGYDDLRDRQKRINELQFTYYNDPFISRVVQLAADEATQLDVQDRLISVESADPRLVERVYALFDQWGVTQTRVHGALFDLELMGESFWANKVTPNGVEKIIPLQVNQILERLEFNPTKVAEQIRQRQGNITSMANRDHKVQLLLQAFDEQSEIEDFAEIFETKLFGFVIDEETVLPPWSITHFRLNADHSEFYPYGRPHLLAALAPFKQAASTMTLQSLARIMSFPVTLYKVKTQPGMDESLVWEHVNRVREEYDNVGVSPVSGQSEAYSVNTKIWIPDGLMEVDVKESKADIDFVGDLEMYIDRIAVASGVPKGYLVQEWGGFGNSAISLVEQYKPFARHVYTLQSAFLEGLADLIRLHFVITGEFDYRTPFTLSMRFPAEEMSDEKRSARTASLELATSVMELISQAMGVEDGEPLPDEVVKDILSKYTFLDPTDVLKWTKQVADEVLIQQAAAEEEEGEEDEEGFDLGGGGGGAEDLGFELGGGEELGAGEEGEEGGEEEVAEESGRAQSSGAHLREQQRILERNHRAARKKLAEERLQELKKRYREIRHDVYFEVLEKYRIKEFNRDRRHHMLFNGPEHYSQETFYKVLQASRTGEQMFTRMKTLHEMYDDMRIQYGEDSEVHGELNYDRIRENVDRPIIEGEEDMGYDPQELLESEIVENDINDSGDDERLDEGTVEASYGTVEEYASGAVKARADRKGYGAGNAGFVGKVEMVIEDEVVSLTPQRVADMDNKPRYIVFHQPAGSDEKFRGGGSTLALAVKNLAKALSNAGYEGRR